MVKPDTIILGEGLGDAPRQYALFTTEGILAEIEGNERGGVDMLAAWSLPGLEPAELTDAMKTALQDFLTHYDQHTARFLAEHGTTPWEDLKP